MRIGPFQYLKRDVFPIFKFSPLIYDIFLAKKENVAVRSKDLPGSSEKSPSG